MGCKRDPHLIISTTLLKNVCHWLPITFRIKSHFCHNVGGPSWVGPTYLMYLCSCPLHLTCQPQLTAHSPSDLHQPHLTSCLCTCSSFCLEHLHVFLTFHDCYSSFKIQLGHHLHHLLWEAFPDSSRLGDSLLSSVPITPVITSFYKYVPHFCHRIHLLVSEDRHLLCHLDFLAHCLACSRHSITVYWMSEWLRKSMKNNYNTTYRNIDNIPFITKWKLKLCTVHIVHAYYAIYLHQIYMRVDKFWKQSFTRHVLSTSSVTDHTDEKIN